MSHHQSGEEGKEGRRTKGKREEGEGKGSRWKGREEHGTGEGKGREKVGGLWEKGRRKLYESAEPLPYAAPVGGGKRKLKIERGRKTRLGGKKRERGGRSLAGVEEREETIGGYDGRRLREQPKVPD